MRQYLLFLFIPILLAVGGCASATDNVQPVTTMGGRIIGIPVGRYGPLPGKGNGYEVKQAVAVPAGTDEQHELLYQFALSLPPAAKLQRIKVEDISEEQFGLLVDDQQPWVTDGGWHIDTAPIKANDPRLAWIYTVTMSLRVYRFTITDAAGQQTVLHQVSPYPNMFKSVIRQKWGEKY